MEKVLCSLGARANGAKPASSCCAWLTRMLMIASAWALWPFSTIVRKLTTSGIPKSSQLLMRQMPSVTIMRQSLRRFVISTVAAGASVRTWAITSFTLGLSQKGSGPTGVLVGVCVGPLRAGASAGGAVVTTVGLNTGEMGVGVASGGVPTLGALPPLGTVALGSTALPVAVAVAVAGSGLPLTVVAGAGVPAVVVGAGEPVAFGDAVPGICVPVIGPPATVAVIAGDPEGGRLGVSDVTGATVGATTVDAAVALGSVGLMAGVWMGAAAAGAVAVLPGCCAGAVVGTVLGASMGAGELGPAAAGAAVGAVGAAGVAADAVGEAAVAPCG